MDTLILNADASPMSVIPLSTMSWEDIIMGHIDGVYDVLHEYDDWEVHSAKLTVAVPSVLMLRDYVHVTKRVAFNRANVFMRDDYRCQYCMNDFYHAQHKLTLEHVLPRTYGGRTTWDNIVAACHDCNNKRGHRLDHKRPHTEPIRPDYWSLVKNAKRIPVTIPDERWKVYMNWTGPVTVNPNVRSKPKSKTD